jgi:hypothetical protein
VRTLFVFESLNSYVSLFLETLKSVLALRISLNYLNECNGYSSIVSKSSGLRMLDIEDLSSTFFSPEASATIGCIYLSLLHSASTCCLLILDRFEKASDPSS